MIRPALHAAGQPLTLLDHLVAFSRCLREAGIPVAPSSVMDLCRAVDHLDIARQDDLRAAARATLVSQRDQFETFERVFDAYWLRRGELPGHETPDPRADIAAAPQGRHGRQEPILLDTGISRDGQELQDGRAPEIVACSDMELLAHRDLGSLDEDEIRRARGLVGAMIRSLSNRPGRRYRRHSQRGQLDFRRSLRHSMRQGFDSIALQYRKRRISKLRLLLLCDISGSMSRYSGFFLEFIYALGRELPSVEAAVFATHMTPVTELLRRPDLAGSLLDMASTARGWGGGTDIGQSLREFNERFVHEMVRGKTVVVILSDGWDRGDEQIMRDAIARLRQRADSLIWLNPLLGRDDYQPLCRGMRTALPYLDHFLPVHSLASLAAAATLLRRI